MSSCWQISGEAQIPSRLAWAEKVLRRVLQAGPALITIGDAPRTSEQNDHFHPLVREIKRHMEANGAAERSERWWRYVLLGKFQGVTHDQDPFTPGGVIVVNREISSKKLGKRKASEFIEFLYALGVDIGVDWSERHRAIRDEHGKEPMEDAA